VAALQQKKNLIISGILFGSVLLISLLFYGFYLNNRIRVMLFFPDFRTGKLVPEERYIVNRKSKDLDLKEFMDELLLGSSRPHRTALLPRETHLILAYEENKKAIIKLSYHFLNEDKEIPVDFYSIVQSIVNNILFNFISIKEVEFYIEGEKLPMVNLKDQRIYINKFDFSLLQ